MAEKETNVVNKQKVAKVVALRNRFFFMLYRYSILVFLTSLLSTGIALFFLFFFARHPVPPQYIPINEDGTYIKLKPLNECKADKDVQKFVSVTISRLYKYDFINYADQLQSVAGNFTTDGWNDYLDNFAKSGTLSAVKENRWVVSVEQEGIPLITKNWVEDNVCKWELKTPISLRYIGSGNSETHHGDLYMRVVRNSVINNPDGLGVQTVVFQEKK
jgi:intracellular multiplication protein IcmL